MGFQQNPDAIVEFNEDTGVLRVVLQDPLPDCYHETWPELPGVIVGRRKTDSLAVSFTFSVARVTKPGALEISEAEWRNV